MDRQASIIQIYKVRHNTGLLAEEILKLGLDLQVIVLDDTTPDSTGELADDLAGQHSGVRVITGRASWGWARPTSPVRKRRCQPARGRFGPWMPVFPTLPATFPGC